jgi:hypothetical protein
MTLVLPQKTSGTEQVSLEIGSSLAWKGTATPFASTERPVHPGVCQSRLRSFWGPLSHTNNIYYSHISLSYVIDITIIKL